MLFLIKMLLEPKLWAPPWILLEEFRALPDTPSRYKTYMIITNEFRYVVNYVAAWPKGCLKKRWKFSQ